MDPRLFLRDRTLIHCSWVLPASLFTWTASILERNVCGLWIHIIFIESMLFLLHAKLVFDWTFELRLHLSFIGFVLICISALLMFLCLEHRISSRFFGCSQLVRENGTVLSACLGKLHFGEMRCQSHMSWFEESMWSQCYHFKLFVAQWTCWGLSMVCETAAKICRSVLI